MSITNTSGVEFYYIEKAIIKGKNTILITDIKLAPSVYYLNIRGSGINKTIPVIKTNN
jgi:hypothetical protein